MAFDIYNYKPRAAARIEVPRLGSVTESIIITPSILAAKWTLNNHLVADELTITFGWEESGCDPRYLKNATCEFYMWDDARQNQFDITDRNKSKQYLRFAGICTKASRKLTESTSEVTMTFNDYTTLFIHMKPFPTDGMPEYSDTLEQIWQKICDYTGAQDPAAPEDGKTHILSTVKALRDNLDMSRLLPEQREWTMGKIVPPRFHAIDKPSIPNGANAWEAWMWCTGALGLVSYIQGDKCVIMTTTEHYNVSGAPQLIYGHNIMEFEENSDTSISGKGIMLKSFDHLTKKTIEAVYPKPGDERLKLKQATAKRAKKAGREIDINDVSGDYEEFNYFGIQDQEALDIRAKEAYEEFSRQQMTGTIKTMEMALEKANGEVFDILDLKANDSLLIKVDPDLYDFAKNSDEAYQYLVRVKGYNDGLARIIAQNFDNEELQSPQFHVTTMDVDYQDQTCAIEIKYHNLVNRPKGAT